MRPCLLLAIALTLLPASLNAVQPGSPAPALRTGYSAPAPRSARPDSLRTGTDAAHLFSNQLVHVSVFEPDCIDYFPQAVRELGFFGALFSTVDRMTRSTRIGAALSRPGRDGKVHEGPEAYRRRKKKQ